MYPTFVLTLNEKLCTVYTVFFNEMFWLCYSGGFIDFIVEPTFSVLTEMMEKILPPLLEEASCFGLDGSMCSR